MVKKYLIMFLISMVPIVELRGAIPYAAVFGIPTFRALIICMIGNMLPVPVIFWFARRVLMWGRDKKYIGKFFTWCIQKGEKGGQKLLCGNSTPGYRCLDGNVGSQLLGSGLEEECTCCYGRRRTCRSDCGSCKLWTAWNDRSIILIL